MKWRYSVLPRPAPKKSKFKNPLEKFSLRFFYQDGILLIGYLQKGQTIKAGYYSLLPVQLKDILKKNAAGRSPM
jgi:hypothetical protein